MHRKSAVPPGQQVIDDVLGDQVLAQEHAQQLGPEETLDEADIEVRTPIEGAVGTKDAVGDQQMDMRVKIQ